MEKNKFKLARGGWMTKSLFAEFTVNNGPPPVFSLRGDAEGFPSLKNLFIELNDHTGVLLAEQYLGGWEHWEALMENQWFSDEVQRWKRQVLARMEREAVDVVKVIASDEGNKGQLAAARLLLDISAPKEPNKRGRPSKEEVSNQLKQEAEREKTLLEDAQRIGKLHVINGGKK